MSIENDKKYGVKGEQVNDLAERMAAIRAEITEAKAIAISGSGEPTESTEGVVGELYLDISSGSLYVLVSIEEESGESGEVYNWVAVGGNISVTGVSITSPASDTDLYIGDSNITLSCEVSPSSASDQSVTWTTSDDSLVEIVYNSSTGEFEAQAVANGTATITVETNDGGYTDSVEITAKTYVTGVSVSPSTYSPILNSTVQLTATVTPSTASDQSGTWSSSDTSVATVDSNGLVTAVAEGTATITFTTTDGGYTATSTITPVDTPTTWAAVQSAVQAGKAANYWSVGDEIDIACDWTSPSSGTQYSWVWVVADIGTTYKESDTSTAVPCMTLIAKYTTDGTYAFDAAETRVACDSTTEITAVDGVYYFGYDGSSYTSLGLSTGDAIPYSSYTAIYKTSVTSDASQYNNIVNYGYNNWQYSNVRQWLNSDDSAGNWYSESHVGDAAPSYSSQAGFLSGFDSDFLAVLTATRSGVAGNTATDSGTTYYTYDKMFLPSAYEVHADTSLSDEGPVFSLYSGASSSDRIKYDISTQSTARSWWLRSCNRGNANSEYYISSSGNLGNSNASTAIRLAPACRIC